MNQPPIIPDSIVEAMLVVGAVLALALDVAVARFSPDILAGRPLGPLPWLPRR